MPRLSQPLSKQASLEEYVAVGRAMPMLLAQGLSWSGRERNCAFLNCGPRHVRFANISAATGLDYADDGRGLVLVDWDHDGDLDIWLRNRNGPRLRLMLNRTRSPGRISPPPPPLAKGGSNDAGFVALRLRGTTCNRDAIGARVEVHLENPTNQKSKIKNRKSLFAGNGFISQSSKWLHFGLGKDPEIDHVSVRWPGGQWERFADVRPGGRYILVQGSGYSSPSPSTSRGLKLAPSTQMPPTSSPIAHVFLSNRYPLPMLPYTQFGDVAERVIDPPPTALLVNLWASWCLPCIAELKEFGEHEDELRAVGLDILALSVDGLAQDHPTHPADAKRLLQKTSFPFDSGLATPELLDKIQIILDILFARHEPIGVPFSILLDREGRLAAIYRGRVGVDTLVRDVSSLDASPQRLRDLAVPFPGRWYSLPFGLNLRPAATRFKDRYVHDQIRYLEWALAEQAARRGRAGDSEQKRTYLIDQQAGTHNDLGVTLQSQDKFDEAIHHYRQALQIKPEFAEAHFNLGIALASLNKLDEAIHHYRQSLQVKPDHATAHNNLGEALRAQGRLDEAIDHYRQALQIKPDYVDARNNLGVALASQGKLESAIPEFRQALEIRPEHPQAHYNLGLALSSRGQLDEAMRHFRQVLRLEPDHPGAQYRLGIALLKTSSRREEGWSHLRRAVNLKPNWPPALNAMAWELATQADPSDEQINKALELAQRACDLTKNQNPAVLDTLAVAYAAAGRFDQAVQTAQAALALAAKTQASELATQIRKRLELYKRQNAYREP